MLTLLILAGLVGGGYWYHQNPKRTVAMPWEEKAPADRNK